MTKRRLLIVGRSLLGAWFVRRRNRRVDIKTVTFGPTTMVTTSGE